MSNSLYKQGNSFINVHAHNFSVHLYFQHCTTFIFIFCHSKTSGFLFDWILYSVHPQSNQNPSPPSQATGIWFDFDKSEAKFHIYQYHCSKFLHWNIMITLSHRLTQVTEASLLISLETSHEHADKSYCSIKSKVEISGQNENLLVNGEMIHKRFTFFSTFHNPFKSLVLYEHLLINDSSVRRWVVAKRGNKQIQG